MGDKVVTNVELFNVSLRNGDSLYFEVTDEFGFVQRFAMKCIETKRSVRYTAEVWLKYQHLIQYRFLVVANGEEAFTSAFCEARAGHVISATWEPMTPQSPAEPKRRRPRPAETTKEMKPAREVKSTAAKPLCQPQFFDQLKLLIDDLI